MPKKEVIRVNSISFQKWQGRLAEWIFIAVVMMYPFFATLSLFLKVNSTPISMAYRSSYLFLALVIILIDILTIKKTKKKYSIYAFYLLAFWVIYLARMYNDFILDGLSRGYASRGFLWFFQYGILGSFIPGFAIAISVKAINFKRLFKNLKFISIPLSLSLLFIVNHEIGINFNLFATRFQLGERAVISPIILSQYGGLIALISFYSMVYSKINLLDTFIWSIGFIILILGASRGPVIAFVLAHFFLILYIFKVRFKSKKLWFRFSLVLLILSIGIIKYVVPILDKIAIFNRIEGTVNEGSGVDARAMAWQSAWSQFIDSPIVGELLVDRALYYYPHNLILEVLMATGILGGLFFFLLLIGVIKKYFYVKDKYMRVLLYLFILHFFYAMFSFSIVDNPQIWVLLVFVASLNNFKPSK